jgi:DDB1- and CUL4-associated factor 11
MWLTISSQLASALNGWNQEQGSVTVHSFNESSMDEGLPRMGAGYMDTLKRVASDTDESDDDDDDEVDNGSDGSFDF